MMTEKHGKFFIIMGILIFLLSLYVITRDPIIGGVGILLGLWNMLMGYRTSKGKTFFKPKDE
ncbi:hypothetical protein SAMN04488102_11536 [Alkalibacterium subtropicum]|uniref:Uncharacterized protein n=1 Tax=Alkalibacterium subtropicum TaxID=753702 RepID=A0A1I1KVJ6_9LACT|nr:hypothetical protein [Alkalibacterium subtropicum]SFC64809.1 hypothetical protein SAMN04488102_11536 [Alkalibacterium subtropicum]